MIIAISSPPPIDTTEFAQKLAEQNGLKIIEDPAPSLCREYGFQTLYDMPQKLQGEIRERLIREHRDLVKTNNDMLLNYSVFEYLADWMRWFWADTPSEKWEEILGVAAESAQLYDQIYHVEAGTLREYDGYIWFDKRNAKQISNLLKCLYTDFQVTDILK